MKQIFQQKSILVLLSVLIVTIVQFFYVQSAYSVIEVYKVYLITAIAGIPLTILVLIYFLRKMTIDLFHRGDEKTYCDSRSKQKRKNTFTTALLLALITGFFTYGIVINTNHWFGRNNYEEIETKILDSEERNAARHSRSGMTRWYLTVEIDDELVTLRSNTPQYTGDTLREQLNFGGAWGIIYRK